MTVNIWPAELAELSKDGTKYIDMSRPEFPAIIEQIADEHDVVVQFNHEDGWYTRLNVYHRLSSKWLGLDAEDGVDDVQQYETEALPVLMFRDRMTALTPLSIADGRLTTREELETVPRGSIIVITEPGWPTILCKFHGEWTDLHQGVEETWRTQDLLGAESLRLLWVAPGEPTPAAIRQDYVVHDEVLVDGRTAYIIGGGQGAYGVRFANYEPKVRHGVPVAGITYVATPERPLSRDAARDRRLPGSNIRCNLCGNHGATWVHGERPGWGALALCPDHAQELEDEHARNYTELKRLRTINFEQEL